MISPGNFKEIFNVRVEYHSRILYIGNSLFTDSGEFGEKA